MATKVRMTLHLAISVAVPLGRDRKIRTALRNHQIAGFVSVPFKKKINTPYSGCEVIFPSPEEARENMSNEQNFRSYYVLKSRIIDLLFRYYFQLSVF